MSRQPSILEPFIASHRRLRLKFEWRDDRFGHTIELVDGGGAYPLLVSVEGMAAENLPPSPPLQQLHLEDRAHGLRVALLVGMAGNDHWSMSVDAVPDGSSLVFDVACRSSRSGVPRGSVYQIDLPHDGSDVEVTESLCRNTRCGWRLSTLPAGEGICAALFNRGGHLRIVPSASNVLTVRWKYRVEL